MIVSDFCTKQSVNFTDFKGDCRSYIDHIVVTKHTQDLTGYCKILHDIPDNLSYHLPVSISINIPLSGNGCNSEINTANNDNSKYIEWNNHGLTSGYCKHFSAFTDKIIIPKNYCDISTMEQAQFWVDEYCKNITEVLHEAADAAVSSMVKSKST